MRGQKPSPRTKIPYDMAARHGATAPLRLKRRRRAVRAKRGEEQALHLMRTRCVYCTVKLCFTPQHGNPPANDTKGVATTQRHHGADTSYALHEDKKNAAPRHGSLGGLHERRERTLRISALLQYHLQYAMHPSPASSVIYKPSSGGARGVG